MISIKLVIGFTHGKFLLTQLRQNKHSYNNHKKEKLSKVIKELGSSETSPTNFQDKLLLQHIRHL